MLTQELKDAIQAAYSTFLESKSLKARYGQRLMIAEVARTFSGLATEDEAGSEAVVAAIEAGTGTGKTVAYSIAAIPLALHAEKQLVISTATVALQEQIVHKDLPDLMNNSGLRFSFALAKGRGRYVCLYKLDNHLLSHERKQPMADFFAEDGFNLDVNAEQHSLFAEMLDKLGNGRWDGDRDSWSEVLDDRTWSLLSTDHIQCAGRRCSHFQSCAFYKAREGLEKNDVIVANHDLVLADLSLGGGKILPEPSKTLYVFDEGHHLPDKAIDHFAHFTHLKATADWLSQVDKNLTRLTKQYGAAGDLWRFMEQLPDLAKALREQQLFALSAFEQQAEFGVDAGFEGYGRPRYRFVNGQVPEELRVQGLELKKGFQQMTDILHRINELLKKALDDESEQGIERKDAEQWLPNFARYHARAEGNFDLWNVFTLEDKPGSAPTARWLELVDFVGSGDIRVCASPILAADALRANLWYRASGVLLTSATLTALGSFDRFSMRSGMPKEAKTLVVPSPFNHAEAGLLRVPDLHVDVRDVQAHSRAIARELPGLLENTKGALVLFSSRKQMQEVFEILDADWRKRILMQGRLSRQETIARHKKRVDEGQASILFGLASFAEGVDLPGEYCEHVVIAKIPFAVPDDPVEASLAEWIEARGGNPFMEITVPDAALKLVQACGRLLRNEADKGQITILDRRLVTQRYGKAILNSLPAFARQFD